MHRIDTPTAQKDKFGAGKNGFTRGNPQTGTPATDLDDDYFDMLQEELAGVVEASGVNLEKSKHNQLLTALKALLLSRAHPFADIKADGAAAIAEALSNLGITQALALKAPLASPSFSGTPSVPTADQAKIDFRIANTAFVAQAIANLNGGAPAVLNTLKKLASAINNDANFYSTVNSALRQKASLSDFTSSKTSTSVVGNQPGGLRFMCGYITVQTDSNGNIFITLPDTFLGGVIYFEA
ncbi:hypothetical protein MX851_003485, partial [Citrobacter freundii]